jgi:hypothetical protein
LRTRSAFLVLAVAAVATSMACSSPREDSSADSADATGSIPASTTTIGTAAVTPGPSGTPGVTPSGTAGVTGPPTGETMAGKQVISVSVTNGQVNPAPAPVDVELGRNVIIELVSDTTDEIHVHGYEITAPVTAGQTTRVTVVATIPGQFEVELHETRQLLLMLRVQ